MPVVHGLAIADYERLGEHDFRVGDYVAHRIADDLEWGSGAITPANQDADSLRRLAALSVASLQEVEPDDQGYDDCTDGRFPLSRNSGGLLLPVLPALVGSSMGTALSMADALGERFFDDPTASIRARAEQVAQTLHDGGIHPTTHENCGARENFVGIHRNVIEFVTSQHAAAYLGRAALMLGARYNEKHNQMVINSIDERVENQAYGYLRYSPDMLWQAVNNVEGTRGIHEVYHTDPRGIHGHVEETIMRFDPTVLDAVNKRLLAELTKGRQVFPVNDSRIDDVAAVLGGDDAEAVSIARHAGEHFTNAGHGTLATHMPTWRVSKVAA